MIYRFGAFTLDTETFELKSGAQTVAAEPKVFLLLKYLIENRARVLSRDDITDAVWDGRAVSESALTYAIKEARRLTGDDGKTQAVIRTLPRLGFRFVAAVTESSDAEEAAGKQESGTSPSGHLSPANRRWRIPALAAVLVVIVAAGGLARWQPWIERDEPLDPDRLAFQLPEKPSIAVLPFDNLSGDPKQDFFSDGMSEIIITTLSKIPEMFVIARNSSFTYKGKPVKVQQVAEELGVRYVLEGSVQRSGENVRITAQLIDALTGRHIWAESYDRQLANIFDLQDDIARNVVTELEVKLTDGEQARIWRRQTDNPKAYERYLLARDHFSRYTKAEINEAQRLLQDAIELDPNYENAWSLMASSHQVEARTGWSDNRGQSLARASDTARKALGINDANADTYLQLANIDVVKLQYDQAITHCEKALSLDPPANVLAHCGRIWTYVDRPQEAIELIKEAMRRDPYFAPVFHFILGNALYHLGFYDEAVAAFEAYRDGIPKSKLSLGMLAVAYVEAGRIEEARATVEENIKRDPGASVKWWARFFKIRDPAKMEHALENLRKAGMPEG